MDYSNRINTILVTGNVVSGKSSLISALIGNRFLRQNCVLDYESEYFFAYSDGGLNIIESNKPSYEINIKNLPRLNVILYCMNCLHALSISDMDGIMSLIKSGYKNILFVLTYYDFLLFDDEMNGTNDAEDAKHHYTKILAKYTDFGENGIFFVGSLPALKAKRTNDQELLIRSNIIPLEKCIEEILQ